MTLRCLPLATLAMMILAPVLPAQDAESDRQDELLRRELLERELIEREHAEMQRARADQERARAAEAGARYEEAYKALQEVRQQQVAAGMYEDALQVSAAAELARYQELAQFGAEETRPMIGITTRALDDGLSQHLGVNPDEVLMIAEVMEGMPAETAGLKPYDILLSVNGVSPVNLAVLRQAIRDAGDGGEIAIDMLRDGQRAELIIGVLESAVGGVGVPADIARRMLEQAQAAQNDAQRRVDLEQVLAAAQQQMIEQHLVEESERASVLQALNLAQAELALRQEQELVEREMSMVRGSELQELVGELSRVHEHLARQLGDNQDRSADLRDRMAAVLESGHPEVAEGLHRQLAELRDHEEHLHAEIAEINSRLAHERGRTAYLGALGAGRALMLPSPGDGAGGGRASEHRFDVIEDRLAGIEDRLAHIAELLERLVPHERNR